VRSLRSPVEPRTSTRSRWASPSGGGDGGGGRERDALLGRCRVLSVGVVDLRIAFSSSCAQTGDAGSSQGRF
jgi:hypothetical protein